MTVEVDQNNDSDKFKIILKSVPRSFKIKDVKNLLKPIKPKSVSFLKAGIVVAYFKNEKELLGILQESKKIEAKGIKASRVDESTITKDSKTKTGENKFPQKSKEKILEEINLSGCIFVRNLDYSCEEKNLVELFEKFGTLTNVNLITDSQTKLNKGYAKITFMFPKDAVSAFNKLDKTKFMNRLLHILPGEEKEEGESSKTEQKEEDFLTKYKDEHLSDLKSDASVSHNWNALFISQEAVVAYLADKFQTTKEKILDCKSKKSSAVRMAHGEAQMVNEIRQCLESEGVDLNLLDEFEKARATEQRHKSEAKSSSTVRIFSGTVFMIKNLPLGTNKDSFLKILRKLVNHYDESVHVPKRVICPALGVTVIVEFNDSQAAKHVYKCLAYEKYKDNLLIVQWAPEKLLDGPRLATSVPAKVKEESASVNTSTLEMPTSAEMEELYEMRKLKDTKKEAEENEKTELKSVSNKEKQYGKKSALKYEKRKLESTENEEFDIVKEPEEIEQPSAKISKTEQPNNILIVRNIPFQATVKEIKSIFSPVLGFMNARLPSKVGGGHRGFGFVEFDSVENAQVALNSLGKVTHFLGRRLLIDFAKNATA